MLRFHGSHDKVTYEQVGYNRRLDELQAAILRVLLPHLDGWAAAAAPAAATTRGGLGELSSCPPRRRRAPGMAPLRRPHRARRPARRPSRAGTGTRLLPHAGAPPAGDEETPPTPTFRPPRGGATHLAIPMSPVLSAEQAAEVTDTVRAAGPGRSMRPHRRAAGRRRRPRLLGPEPRAQVSLLVPVLRALPGAATPRKRIRERFASSFPGRAVHGRSQPGAGRRLGRCRRACARRCSARWTRAAVRASRARRR